MRPAQQTRGGGVRSSTGAYQTAAGKIIHESGQVHMSKEQFMRFLQTRSQLQLSKLYGQFDPIDEL
jgi:hypothetical protein